MLRIKDVIQSKSSAIWSVSPKDSVFKAIEIMTEKNIGALLVIDEEHVVGIVSERDIARNVVLKRTVSQRSACRTINDKGDLLHHS